jgi:acetyltransferase-like isoleucine patch superfamily enzyme
LPAPYRTSPGSSNASPSSVSNKPSGFKLLVPGTVFDYAWSLEGVRWIEIAQTCNIRHHVNTSAVSNNPEFHSSAVKLRIGSGIYTGPYCFFIALQHITIGSGIVFSKRMLAFDNFHKFHSAAGPIKQKPFRFGGAVAIGDNTFIGYGACILPGARTENQCVVGANSVVISTFADLTLIAANPGHSIRSLNPEAGPRIQDA